jgi:hypothetical protein
MRKGKELREEMKVKIIILMINLMMKILKEKFKKWKIN